jgi:DNA-binding response OmpR family regulator
MRRCLYLANRPDSALLRTLREGSGRCRTANTREARSVLASEPYDVVICEGAGAIATVAAAMSAETMLLAVLDRDDKDLRLEALRARADVCLTRPLSTLELTALIEAFFRRRSRIRQPEPAEGDAGNERLVLTARLRSAVFRGNRLQLSSREFQLLSLLLEAGGVPLERSAIWQQIWGEEHALNPDLIDQAVLRLRRKLDGCPVRILNVRNVGYRAEGFYRLA